MADVDNVDLKVLAFSWNTESRRLCESLDPEVVSNNRTGTGESLIEDYLPGWLSSSLPRATTYQLNCEIADFMYQLDPLIEQNEPNIIAIGFQEDASPGSYFHSHFIQSYMKERSYYFVNRNRLLGAGKSTFGEATRTAAVSEVKLRGLRLSVFADLSTYGRYSAELKRNELDISQLLGSYSCNQYNSKGGISVTVPLGSLGTLCIIDLHLPFNAGSLIEAKQKRDPMIRKDAVATQNACFNAIIRNLVKSDTLPAKPTQVIAMGDFNYRLSIPSGNVSAAEVANDLLSGYHSDSVKETVRKYLPYDELTLEIRKGNVYPFEEGVPSPIGPGPLFLPTCKMKLFDSEENKRRHVSECQFNDNSRLPETGTKCWNVGKEDVRMPSWCDRILHYNEPESRSAIACREYDRFDHGATMQLSDHAGVYAIFDIVPNLD